MSFRYKLHQKAQVDYETSLTWYLDRTPKRCECFGLYQLFVNSCKIIIMEITQQQPSTFAEMIDKLRFKPEAELKRLYIQFFGNELKSEWQGITKEVEFKNTSEEDIVAAIQKNRYANKDV